jgi:hypothetical protein
MSAKATLAICLTVVAALALAQPRRLGSWAHETVIGRNLGYWYAGTVNDSGHLFGQFCLGDGNCMYLLGIKTSCNPGDRYPVLVDANVGSSRMELLCRAPMPAIPNAPMDGRYPYVFSDFDKIDHVVKRALEVGVALRLDNDQFAARFDLRGANEAIAAMRSQLESAREEKDPLPSWDRKRRR